jgi:hypothetical protein
MTSAEDGVRVAYSVGDGWALHPCVRGAALVRVRWTGGMRPESVAFAHVPVWWLYVCGWGVADVQRRPWVREYR